MLLQRGWHLPSVEEAEHEQQGVARPALARKGERQRGAVCSTTVLPQLALAEATAEERSHVSTRTRAEERSVCGDRAAVGEPEAYVCKPSAADEGSEVRREVLSDEVRGRR
jgi:hypothetical protein